MRSNVKFILRKYVPFVTIALVMGLVLGCNGGGGKLTAPTMTAQSERAIRLATQIARGTRLTEIAEEARLQATAQAAREEVENWPVVLGDDFSTDTGAWILGEDEDPSLASIRWTIEEGVYRWEASAYDAFVWWVTPDAPDVADFSLVVDVFQAENKDVGERGILFRQDDTLGYYTFEINNQQQFGVFFYDLNAGEWYSVVDWQASAQIRPDWSNTLGVVGRGEQLYFYINEQRVAEARDSSSLAGSVGLLIGLSNSGEQATWEYDDFELRAPELPVTEETPTPTP